MKDLRWILFILLALNVSNLSAGTVETHGTGRSLVQAKDNSYISAHFQCNRKGMWADLDQLQVTGTDRYVVRITGGRKKYVMYRVDVSTVCTADYQKTPTEIE